MTERAASMRVCGRWHMRGGGWRERSNGCVKRNSSSNIGCAIAGSSFWLGWRLAGPRPPSVRDYCPDGFFTTPLSSAERAVCFVQWTWLISPFCELGRFVTRGTTLREVVERFGQRRNDRHLEDRACAVRVQDLGAIERVEVLVRAI